MWIPSTGLQERGTQHFVERPLEKRRRRMSAQFRNLVFEGGGVKGIAYVGAMQVLSQRGLLNTLCASAAQVPGQSMP